MYYSTSTEEVHNLKRGEIEQLVGGGEDSLPQFNPPSGGRETVMRAVLG